MSSTMTRQIALATVFATCALIGAVAVAAGLDADASDALVRAAPLAILCAVALTVLLADPFQRS